MHTSPETLTTPLKAIEPTQVLQIIGGVLTSEGLFRLEGVRYVDQPGMQGVTSGIVEKLALDTDTLATRLEGGERYIIESAVNQRAYPGLKHVGIHSLRPEVVGPGTRYLAAEIKGSVRYMDFSSEGAELWRDGMPDPVLIKVAEGIAQASGNL